MNQVLSLALILSLFLAFENQTAAAETKDRNVNQVMVTYKSNKQNIKIMKVPARESASDFINKLGKHSNIASVEPDYVMNSSAKSKDPSYKKQWYHQVIGSDKAWGVTTGSKDMVVAVIDDGIDIKHKDLMNQIIAPYDVLLDSTTKISIGEHGTHVSGIIASMMNNGIGGTGIAPNVKIMPINVFDNEEALYSDVIVGIDYAIEHDADIINLSLGGTEDSELLNDAIQRAYQAGILIIAAAGNDGENINDYPASYDHVIAVSATNQYDKIAYFSNYGPNIDIAAPGTDIYSTLPYNKFGYMSGTSMAVPVVSGVAALIWSVNPSLTNTQVEEQLYKTADDLGRMGKDIYYGNGRINANKAVATVSSIPQEEWTLTVNDISDSDTLVKGTLSKIVQDGTITIYTDETTIATAKIDHQNSFSIKIPKQLAGTKVYIKVDNPTINPVSKMVMDKTAPSKPVVQSVGDDTKKVTGTAEAGSTVIVISGSQQLGTGITNKSGKFTVIMTKKQKAGTVLIITATDKAGNISLAKKVFVQGKTAPQSHSSK